jgi:bifunctional DNase/RNase
MAMAEMKIVDLCTCRRTNQPMVLLENGQRSRWLSFYLPMNEANRLARVLGKAGCRHVPIFELLELWTQAADVRDTRAEIHGDADGVRASLVLARGGLDMVLPCHPVDAMAIALRVGAPILAADTALAHACPADQALRAETVQRWIDGLRPADLEPEPHASEAMEDRGQR